MGLNGKPVRVSVATTALNSAVNVGLYEPGTNTLYTLQPNEAVVFEALTMTTEGGNNTFLLTSSTFDQAHILLPLIGIQGGSSIEWRDDDTGALSGTPGVLPTVFINGGNAGNTYLTGTAQIVTYPGIGKQGQPWVAKLTPGGNY